MIIMTQIINISVVLVSIVHVSFQAMSLFTHVSAAVYCALMMGAR